MQTTSFLCRCRQSCFRQKRNAEITKCIFDEMFNGKSFWKVHWIQVIRHCSVLISFKTRAYRPNNFRPKAKCVQIFWSFSFVVVWLVCWCFFFVRFCYFISFMSFGFFFVSVVKLFSCFSSFTWLNNGFCRRVYFCLDAVNSLMVSEIP